MIRTCELCDRQFDDARQLTFCPHAKLMSDADMDQKILGLSLIGKTLTFNHEPDGPERRVSSVGWNGMVSINGMDGEFAPHLFRVTKSSFQG